MIYKSQYNALLPEPEVKEPDEDDSKYYGFIHLLNTAVKTFKKGEYDKDVEAYNNWLSTHIAVSPELEKCLVDKQKVREDIDYKIEYQVQGQGDEWIESKELYEIYIPEYRKTIAIPIKREEDKEPLPQQERWRLIDPNNYDSATQFYSDCWKSAADELSEALAKIKSQEAEIAELRKQFKP
jgi:hypothetical protein